MNKAHLRALLVLAVTAFSAHAAEPGLATYQSVCIACHAVENVMVSAPKAGDSAAWQKRLAAQPKGLESLTDNAMNGIGAMPAKGGRDELTREQVQQAIRFMMTPRR